MVLGEEEGLEYEVCVDGICLEHFSEFKYSGCVLDESECSRKVSSVRRVAGARNLQLQCAMVLHESLLVPVLTYEGRRRGLGLGLYSSTSSEVCYVSGD